MGHVQIIIMATLVVALLALLIILQNVTETINQKCLIEWLIEIINKK